MNIRTERSVVAALVVGVAALTGATSVVAASPATTEPPPSGSGTAGDSSEPPLGSMAPDAPTATVGLSVLAPAPALELAASGFKDGAAACRLAHIDVVERNAEGDIPSLTAIAEGFLGDGVDLIATVTTPAAQAAYQVVGAAGGTTPVVFSVVTDPFAAGLAEDPETHEPWITGTQSLPPFAAVIDAAQEILPDVSVLGVLQNPSEANSQAVVDALQSIADERGLTLEVATVADSSEVAQAAEALVGRGIDAFVVPTDTTVVSGMAAMVQIADDNDLLVIGTDANHAIDGAAIGLGTDYYASGERGAEIACQVLGGKATPADFDVLNVESLGIAVNLAAADAQGVTIPDDLLEQAEIVG
jgi:putative tryptophan/tyrosine transport system substrate-binding protein